MRATEIIEKAKEEMCDHYCKMPSEWEKSHPGNYDDDENLEAFWDECCQNCPLNRI